MVSSYTMLTFFLVKGSSSSPSYSSSVATISGADSSFLTGFPVVFMFDKTRDLSE